MNRIHKACGGPVTFARGNRMARFHRCEKCGVEVEESLTTPAGKQAALGGQL